MADKENPDEAPHLDFTRQDWAYSFMFDWVFPLIRENRLEQASTLIELHDMFHLEDGPEPNPNFSLQDVLDAALRLKDLNAVREREDPRFHFRYTEELDRLIILVNEALNPPPPMPRQLPLDL